MPKTKQNRMSPVVIRNMAVPRSTLVKGVWSPWPTPVTSLMMKYMLQRYCVPTDSSSRLNSFAQNV
jgi:hypothetical protein